MTDPDFDRRFAAATAELQRAGVKPRAAYPPLFQILAGLGLKLRPPFYQSFAAVALTHAAFFGPVWGLAMYVLIWRANQMPGSVAAVMALLAGLLFGTLMAGFSRWQARRKALSRWQDL